MNPQRDRLIDPDQLSALRNFKLIIRGEVEGFLVGSHKSPYRGFSAEFSEHRPYYPGDDLRWLNWKLLARTDKPYIKVFQEETNLRAYIMLDVSASMAYADKLDFAKKLAGSLAFLLHLQRDAVGLIPFSDAVHQVIPPASSRLHIDRLLSALVQVRPGGNTDAAKAFLQIAGVAKRRGLILVISDLMAEPSSVIKGIRAFRARKHHTVVFQVLSPEEVRGPDKPGLYADMETGQKINFHPASVSYRDAFEKWKSQLSAGLKDAGAEFHQITTEMPVSVALRAFLQKRRRLP